MVRSVLSNWVGMTVVGVVSFIVTPYFIHRLGDGYYGLWILVSSLSSYYGLLDMGLRPTVQRFIGHFKGARDRKGFEETLNTALATTLALGIFVLLLSVVLTGFLPGFFRLTGSKFLFRSLVLLVGLEVAISMPSSLLGTCLAGLQRFDLYNFATIVVTLVRAGLQVLALHWGFGVLGIAVVGVGMEALLVPGHWYLLRYAEPWVSITWRKVRWARLLQLANFGLYAFLAGAGNYLRLYTDSVVIGRVLSVALITPFNVAGRLANYFNMVLVGLVSPLGPRLSLLEGEGSPVALRRTFLQGTRFATLLSLFIGGLLLIDGKALIGLWVGERFTSSYNLLVLLTVGWTVALSLSPANFALYAVGGQRALGFWTMGEGLANLLLSIHWAKSYGLVGVALGTMVPMLATNLFIRPWYTLRVLQIPAWAFLKKALARPLAVAMPFFVLGSLAAIAVPARGVPQLVLVVLSQAVLFASLAYCIGLKGEERGYWWVRVRSVACGRNRPRPAGVRYAGVRGEDASTGS